MIRRVAVAVLDGSALDNERYSALRRWISIADLIASQYHLRNANVITAASCSRSAA